MQNKHAESNFFLIISFLPVFVCRMIKLHGTFSLAADEAPLFVLFTDSVVLEALFSGTGCPEFAGVPAVHEDASSRTTAVSTAVMIRFLFFHERSDMLWYDVYLIRSG